MLAALVPNNRFYTRKLQAPSSQPGRGGPCPRFGAEDDSGWDGSLERGAADAAKSLAEFRQRVPYTSKQELVEDQREHPPYGTNLTYPIDRYSRFSQTSGTSGVPLRWLDTTESWSWMIDNWVEVFRASDVGPEDRVFFAFSFGPFLGFWTAFEAAARLGCLCLPGGGMSSAGRVRALLEDQVTVLCCTPTYALRLAEVAAEEGLDLSRSTVRRILTAGEPGACIPATRARIEALWPGARVRDQHGMTEIGPVTFECPARPGVLHVLEAGFIPEVIDPDTRAPKGPGETGELVLTNLGRIGSPLIRYRTGDLVRRAAEVPCCCGRYDLALEGGILGRNDDMVIVRSVNLYPSAVEEVIRRFDGVAEYRVEVRTERSMTELTLQLEPTVECARPSELASGVAEALRDVFHLRVPVALVPCGTLPRFELKARRWVRLSSS